MDNSNLQSTSVPCSNWRDELDTQDRMRFIVQLYHVLKQLSPAMTDDSIFTAAKNFESTIHNQSVDKNQYIVSFSRKFNQIKYQLQMHGQNKVALGGGTAAANTNVVTMSPSMSVQQGQPSVSPQMQMMQQQTQNMSNTPNPPQQTFMHSQNTTQRNTSQPNQQIQNQLQNHISSEMATSQQPVTVNQPTSLPMTSQNYNGQTLMTPSQQQQQQQQLQLFMARQRALQQQQQMSGNFFALGGMNINRTSMPINTTNDKTAPVQQISMSRQNQSTFPVPQPTQDLATQFKVQSEQRLPPSSFNQANLLQLQQARQQQIQQFQLNQLRQLQQQQQQQGLTGLQQQPAQTNIVSQHQPVMTSIQPQQQQFGSTPLTQQIQTAISAPQRSQATDMVRQLDEKVRTTRVQWPALNNLTDQEKKAIWENVMNMRHLSEAINKVLPVFLALSSNFEATRRLIMMKYLFEDQLNALPRNIYLLTLDHLQRLQRQINSYFAWVQNATNGNAVPIPYPRPQGQQTNLQPQGQQTNFQPQGQQINQQSQGQQINLQTPPATTSSPTVHYSSSNSPPIKRENIDLTLPPSKKQRATIEQPTVKMEQHQQQQGLSSTNIPPTVQWSQVENPSAAIPDCAHASMKTDTPSSTTKNGPTPTATTPDTTQQQNPMTTMMQNDLQSRMMYQAAISSGIPSAIVAILPSQALKCFWLLHQGSLNKIMLSDEQKIRIRQMLDGFIRQAKEQLGGKDQRNEQQQQLQQQHDTPASNTNNFSKMNQQQLHTIDLTLSPPPITTNNSNCAMKNSSTEKGRPLVSSLPPHDLQQRTNSEPTTSTSVPSTTTNGRTSTNAPISATTHTPIASTTTVQPAVLTSSPVSTNLHPGVALDDKVTNPMQYANDVSTIMTNSPTLTTGTSSTPLFVMDDFIIDGNNKSGTATQVTGESYNSRNKNTTDKTSQAILFPSSTTSSESPSFVHTALKEGFKDETFCINELDSNNLPSSINNIGSSSHPDQSSNTSSLSSTSLSSCEPNEDSVKNNNWYQIGMDKDSLGITDSLPGFDFDTDGFISYDSGNRLSHPPLF